MNINLIIKLAKLANNNSNENEANSAARKVCKLIHEGDYKFPEQPENKSQYDPYWGFYKYRTSKDYYPPFDEDFNPFSKKKQEDPDPLIIRKCHNCYNSFSTRKSNASNYCSEKCKYEYENPKLYPIICCQCHKQFLSKYSVTSFCSDKCAADYSVKRND